VSYCEYEYEHHGEYEYEHHGTPHSSTVSSEVMEEDWLTADFEGRGVSARKDGWLDATYHTEGEARGGEGDEGIGLFLDQPLMSSTWGGAGRRRREKSKAAEQSRKYKMTASGHVGRVGREGGGRRGTHRQGESVREQQEQREQQEPLEARLSRKFNEMRSSKAAQAQEAQQRASKIKLRLRGGCPISGGGCPISGGGLSSSLDSGSTHDRNSRSTAKAALSVALMSTAASGFSAGRGGVSTTGAASAIRDITYGVDLSLRKYKFDSPPGGGEGLQEKSELRRAETKAEKKLRLARADAARRRRLMAYG
jgi:hypothetical protein